MKTVCVVTGFLAALAALTFTGAAAAASPLPAMSEGEEAALHLFEERLGAYVTLRRQLEEPLPPLRPTTDMQSVYARRASLAASIRKVRAGARLGAIWGPPVEEQFRRVILATLEGVDVAELLLDLYDEHDVLPRYQPQVHDTYPDWATHAMPALLLLRLPPLPEDIEYRLIGYDLVLLDLRSRLIIDVLPRAIPPIAADDSALPAVSRTLKA